MVLSGQSARRAARSAMSTAMASHERMSSAPAAAPSDHAAVITHRCGALEEVALLLDHWDLTGEWISQAEHRMTAVRDELGLTGVVTATTPNAPTRSRA
jgi:hypothetical protein